MCGGGGSSIGPSPTPARVSALVQEATQAQERTDYQARANDVLLEALQQANARDSAAVGNHLGEIQAALEDRLEDSVQLRYGGSVRKHTYVDGLSDVDILVLVRGDVAADASPKDLIRQFESTLRERLTGAEITAGDLSVKVRFADGADLQILPAFRSGTGYRIARPRGESWSGVVRPDAFARSLTSVNQANGGAVVKAIKLTKIAQESLPPGDRLDGYHLESIAVRAFEGYQGSSQPKETLLHLLRRTAEAVRTPVQEPTGQSTYVDSYLGEAGSPERLRIAGKFRRLANLLEVADERADLDAWQRIFSEW